MIKVEVIEKFTLKKFEELKNIKRASKEYESPRYDGVLIPKDTFECSEEMAKYLTGNNAFKKVVVKIIEVKPKEEPKVIAKEEKVQETEKKNKKKKTSKK